MAQQVNATPTNIERTDYLKVINERYLNLFNFSSSTCIRSSSTQDTHTYLYYVGNPEKLALVTIDSTININPDSKKGYTYNAEFKSGKEFNCLVHESILETTNGNQVTTDINQTVKGSYDFTVTCRENKIIGTTTAKQSDAQMELTNSTGSYFMNIKSDLTLESDGTTILQGKMIVDENFYEPKGQYIVELEKKPVVSEVAAQLNASATAKVTVTMPNGDIIDPEFWSWNDYGSIVHLNGYAVAWYTHEQATLAIILTILGAVLAITTPFGITVFVIAVIWDSSSFFINSYGLTCMYLQTLDISYIPLYAEAGYYTDTIYGYPLGGWYFCPLFPSGAPQHVSVWPLF